ncbi:MAG: ribonuclease III [Candidatus Aureabacteria bacterium]|nr:ribonuclease III [Candidatus Auribacterota bacterium]
MRKPDYINIQKKIGYRFKSKSLLFTALVHKSFRNENLDEIPECNERLEFLGDSVLGCVVSSLLYKKFPDMDEGKLSFLKSFIVSRKVLSEIAGGMELGTELIIGKGEEKSGGREKESNLANVFEALIAAIYLDGGYKSAEKWIAAMFKDRIKKTGVSDKYRAKNKLQELTQSRYNSLPVYNVVEELGPEHKRKYTVEVLVEGETMGRGNGFSKKEAERNAANEAVKKMR